MKDYVLAIDQSTQGTKASVFGSNGELCASAYRPHSQIVDQNGWVSHDLKEIQRNIIASSIEAIHKSALKREEIRAIGVTNQRESVGCWNRDTGEPLSASVVWQCSRAKEICEALDDQQIFVLQKTTGLRVSPFFSAPKIAWMIKHVPGASELAESGKLVCGTMDTWTIHSLTGDKAYYTDSSNASRTMLLNLKEGVWDQTACQIFDIPQGVLPVIKSSDACFGWTDLQGYLPKKIPIHSAIGDSHAALFAQGCTDIGDCMAGHGTGTCVMMNIGKDIINTDFKIPTSIAWRFGEETTYLVDGVINNSGGLINWIVNELSLAKDPNETSALAFQANQSDATYFVPFFSGAGAPYWDSHATATVSGMTRLTGKNELIRASLDSIAYQTADILHHMSRELNIPVTLLKVSGKPAQNDYLMQFQSDILGCKVQVPSFIDLTLRGAAQIASIASGISEKNGYEGLNYKTFAPTMMENQRNKHWQGWHHAVDISLSGRI